MKENSIGKETRSNHSSETKRNPILLYFHFHDPKNDSSPNDRPMVTVRNNAQELGGYHNGFFSKDQSRKSGNKPKTKTEKRRRDHACDWLAVS